MKSKSEIARSGIIDKKENELICKILAIRWFAGSNTRRGGVKTAAEAWTSVQRRRGGIEVDGELIFVCNKFDIRNMEKFFIVHSAFLLHHSREHPFVLQRQNVSYNCSALLSTAVCCSALYTEQYTVVCSMLQCI